MNSAAAQEQNWLEHLYGIAWCMCGRGVSVLQGMTAARLCNIWHGLSKIWQGPSKAYLLLHVSQFLCLEYCVPPSWLGLSRSGNWQDRTIWVCFVVIATLVTQGIAFPPP